MFSDTKPEERNAAKEIELAHIATLERWGYEVVDERDNENAWRDDYDVTVTNPNTSLSTKIDFKTDNTIALFGNIFYELCMMRPEPQKPFYKIEKGWFTYSKADYVMFWCPDRKKGYITDMKLSRKIIEEQPEHFTYKMFSNKKDVGSYNLGLLCSVDKLQEMGVITTTYKLFEGSAKS